MGSLMGGWDSHVSDPKSVLLRRNSSTTKEEIEAYWKSKKKTEEEHLKSISPLLYSTNQFKEAGNNFLRSNSMPMSGSATKVGFVDKDVKANIVHKNGWWTRSNWAFLNETPVLEQSSSYPAQFHVADLGRSKLNRETGIGT